MKSEESKRQAWEQRARVFALHFNVAWWLTYFLPVFFVLSLLQSVALLVVRSQHGSLLKVWTMGACIAILAALAVAWGARKRFLSSSAALAQLDWASGLNTQLCAAHEGVASWPDHESHQYQDGFRWDWRRTLAPLGAGLLLLVAASFIPVKSVVPVVATPAAAELPAALSEVEAWSEKLEHENVLSEESLEKLKQELHELTAKEPEEWFEHGNLEAAESLKEKTAGELKALLGSLEKIEGLIASDLSKLSETERLKLDADLQEALTKMESGELALPSELNAKLSELAKSGLQSVQPSARIPLTKELREKIKKLEESAKSAVSPGQNGASNGATQGGQIGEGGTSGSCSGGSGAPMCIEGERRAGGAGGEADGTEAGQSTGGVSRGPGHVPLNLAEKSPQLTSNRSEALPPQGRANLEPGELIGLASRAPELEPHASAGQAGEVHAVGDGGGVTWKNSFTPDEEEVLKRYFK